MSQKIAMYMRVTTTVTGFIGYNSGKRKTSTFTARD